MRQPNCALCAVYAATPMTIRAFEARVMPLLRQRCLCHGLPHPIMCEHPHVQAGCVGFAWQAWHKPEGVTS
jgi:hypothetical protein